MFVLTGGALPGTPKPQVTWRKGPSSEPLRGRPGLGGAGRRLSVPSLCLPLASGDYECQATNGRAPRPGEPSWWSMVSRDPRAGGDGTLGEHCPRIQFLASLSLMPVGRA